MSDEAVTKQIEGVVEETSQKNGWTTFSIDVGSQYPVRLSTKLDAIIAAANAVGQQKAVWTFQESQGGENPNRPGTHYTNRRLEKVEVGGTITHPASTAGGRPRDDETRRSIERQTIVKAAVPIYDTFSNDPDDGFFFAFLDRLAAWVAEAPVPAAPTAPFVPTPETDPEIPF